MSSMEQQGAVWGTRARDWAEVQEGMVLPLYQTVLARLQLQPGMRLLDVGCGAGMFCQLAAARGATVAGLDATEPLLAIARERVPGGDFRLGDMEDLPFAGEPFDAVTGFNAFQFASSPLNALRQARRVLKPEGTLVIAVWSGPEKAQIARCLSALAGLLPSPPPPGSPGPFALSAEGALGPLAEQAGFAPVRTDEVDCLFIYRDLKLLNRGLLASGPGAAARLEVGDAVARKALAKAAAPFRTAAGTYEFRNTFRYLIARPRQRSAQRPD